MKIEKKKWLWLLAACGVWLLVWELVARWYAEPVFFPYPYDVFRTMVRLVGTKEFWETTGSSVYSIGCGFLAGMGLGTLLACLTHRSRVLGWLLEPLVRLVQTVPVASFVILLLLWVSGEQLSTVVSMLLVLPVFLQNVRQGLSQPDETLCEVAAVFRMSRGQRLLYLTVPAVWPYFGAACRVTAGLCFKAGVAAEIIGNCKKSFGGQLYLAKLFIDTEGLFAWTILLVLVSVLFAKCLALLLSGAGWLAAKCWLLPAPAGKSQQSTKSAGAPASAEPLQQLSERAGMLVSAGKSQQSPERAGAPVSAEPLQLVARHLSKRYADVSVLEEVSLTCRKGEITVLTGASGCGKTTLLRLLAGLTAPESGEILLEDAPVSETGEIFLEQTPASETGKNLLEKMPAPDMKERPFEEPVASETAGRRLWKASRRRKAGAGFAASVCFQEDRLFEYLPAWKNVRLGGSRLSRAELCALLREVGIDEPERKPVGQFSGGMKRRVAFLRSLLSPAQVLLLDEPFTGMDSERIAQLCRLLARKAADRVVLLVTHHEEDLEALRKAGCRLQYCAMDKL